MSAPPGIHPAQFSDNLIEPIVEMLGPHDGGNLLDPCAGLGWKLGRIGELVGLAPTGIEIEPGYDDHAAPWVLHGDSTDLRGWPDRCFRAAVTSFVYPNGMADSFHAKDDSVRHTYVHRLRATLGNPTYELDPNNMATLSPRRSPSARAKFMGIQRQIIAEVFRVLRPGAPFVVNTKNPPYDQHYTEETREQLLEVGFVIEATRRVYARGLNHGANQGGKAEYESLTLARRPT